MKKQAFNPYLPGYEYIPDGEPYVFGDRLYVYGSHDRFSGEAFCMNDYVCWSAPTDALYDWRFEGVIYRKEQDPEYTPGRCMYAPDITVGPDGKYYLYYTLDMTGTMAVAVSDAPAGPFAYYGRVHYPDGRVLGGSDGDVYAFDPGVLTDDDGLVYLYTGFGPKGSPESHEAYFGKRRLEGAYCIGLASDMLTIRTEPALIVPQYEYAAGTEYEAHPFFEASSIRKINGLYYFVYSSTWFHELCYAVSPYPDRGFRAGGPLISNGDVGIDGYTIEHSANYMGNNHGGMVRVGEQWYIFYHRHTNWHGFSRQGCAEPITIEPDGSIRQAELTSCGLNGGDLSGTGRYPASIACRLSAGCGASYMAPSDEFRNLHPSFTQEGPDREENDSQYIANLRENASAGYKYFDLTNTRRIEIEVRGSAGTAEITDRIGGSPLAVISFSQSDTFRPFESAFAGGGTHSALYFRFQTEGSVDFRAFTLE